MRALVRYTLDHGSLPATACADDALHAITEMYGEEGLRQRFALEIAGFPDESRQQLEDALALASQLHRDDRRTREPYLNHLLRTAIRIVSYYEVDDVDVLVATLLHDAVEDHPDELAGTATGDPVAAALEVLADRFNPRVADLVRRSPIRHASRAGTASSSTGNTSPRRCSRAIRGPGSSRFPTSPTTGSASSTACHRSTSRWPPSTGRWCRCSAS